LTALNHNFVRTRSTGCVGGRPRPRGLMIVGTFEFWSNENPIIGSGGTKVDSREHCVTNQLTRPMKSLPEAPTPPADLKAQLRESLLRLHGPLLGGAPLVAALGHRSAASLRQARRRGQVAVPLFTVQNRRGWFALTQDVADWLAEMRREATARGRSVEPS